MIDLFPYAPAETGIASRFYLRTIEDGFRLNLQSGVIELLLKGKRQIFFLYADGIEIGAFHLDASTCVTIQSSDLERYWSEDQIEMRSLQLPRQAVDSTRSMLEWYPPKQSLALQSSDLQTYIEELKQIKASVLLYIQWPSAEAILLLLNGSLLADECLLVFERDIEVGATALRQALNWTEAAAVLDYYESRPETLSHCLLILRRSVQDLGRGILGRYAQLVGRGLAGSMANEINRVMKLSAFQIQAIGEVITNAHVFPSLEQAAKAYSLLFGTIYAHAASVLGEGLTRSLINDTLKSLNPESQNAIREQNILAAVFKQRT